MSENRDRSMKGALKYLKVTAAGMLLASTGTAHMFDAPLNVHADGPATDDQVSQLFESYDILNSKVFNDVYADFWAADSIRWAKSAGLVDGDEYGFFRPNDPMTEYQFATLLTKFYKNLGGSGAEDAYSVLERYRVPLMGYENEYYRNNPVTQGTVVQAIAHIQGNKSDIESAVYYLFDEGVIVGDYTDGRNAYESFGKTDSITNANAVVLFHRLDSTGKAKVDVADLPEVDTDVDAKAPVVVPDKDKVVADAKDKVTVEAPNAKPVLPSADKKVETSTVASKGVSFKSTRFVTTGKAHLRATATTKGKLLLTLAPNTQFSSSYRIGNYYKVTTRGKTGYIHANQFKKYVAPKSVTMYTKKALKVYTSTSTKSKSKGSLKVGTAVNRLAVKGSWSQIRVGNVTGWVANRDLQTTKPVIKKPVTTPVKKPTTPVKKPTPSKPDVVTEKFSAKAFKVTANLTVRSTYSASGTALTSIPNGTVIKSGERYNGWYKLTFNGKTGWVSGKYLVAYTPASPAPAPSKPAPKPPVSDGGALETKAKQVFGSSFEYVSESKNDVMVFNRSTRETFNYGAHAYISDGSDDFLMKSAKFITDIHGGNPRDLVNAFKNSDARGEKFGKYTVYAESSGSYKVLY